MPDPPYTDVASKGKLLGRRRVLVHSIAMQLTMVAWSVGDDDDDLRGLDAEPSTVILGLASEYFSHTSTTNMVYSSKRIHCSQPQTVCCTLAAETPGILLPQVRLAMRRWFPGTLSWWPGAPSCRWSNWISSHAGQRLPAGKEPNWCKNSMPSHDEWMALIISGAAVFLWTCCSLCSHVYERFFHIHNSQTYTPCRIRSCDHLLRRQTSYPTELTGLDTLINSVWTSERWSICMQIMRTLWRTISIRDTGYVHKSPKARADRQK